MIRRPSGLAIPRRKVIPTTAGLNISSSAEYSLTTNLPANITNFTFCYWFFHSDSKAINDWETPGFSIGLDDNSAYFYCQYGRAANTLDLWGLAGSPVASHTTTPGYWYFVAVTKIGTACKMYIAPAYQAGLTIYSNTDSVSFTPETIYVGETVWSGENFDGQCFNNKVWTRGLLPGEVERERWSLYPVHRDNLYAHWILRDHTDVWDYSGNGHHLTASGSPTTEEARGLSQLVDNFFMLAPGPLAPTSFADLSSQSAYIAGTDTASDSKAAYIAGSLAASDSQAAYVAGVAGATDTKSAYIAGTATATDSQAAYLAGADTATDAQAAYVTGQATSADTQSAYIAGTDTATDAQAAYIVGAATATDSQAAYINGATAGGSVSDSKSAYVEGLTYFPFTEDFTGQADNAEWRRSHWVTSAA